VESYKSPECIFQEDGNGDGGEDGAGVVDMDQLRVIFPALVADKWFFCLQGFDDLFYVFKRDIFYYVPVDPQVGRVLPPFIGLRGKPFCCGIVEMILEYI